MPPHNYTSEKHRLDELNHVEGPFLNQLEGLGWEIIRLEMKTQKPEESLRESFNEVVMIPKLWEALHRINEWMDDDQIEDVIRRITIPEGNDLIENNRRVIYLLLEGASVSENRRTGDKSP